MNIDSMEQALVRISELEREIVTLQQLLELQCLGRSGRRPHDEKWQKNCARVVFYMERGYTVSETARQCRMSERTIYRYKAFWSKFA